MPMTDHEKLRVHSRSSSDLLAAVPIKKRRVLFARSPSPPPESPSPIPAHCGISENVPESSEPVTHCSKAGTNSAQANIVKSEVASCEFRNVQPQMAADFGIPEKKPESSDLSPFAIAAGNPAQVNTVTCKFASPAESCMYEKKLECPDPASHLSTIEGNPVQVNAIAVENAYTELPLAAANCGLSEKKPESSEQLGSLSSKIGANPAEVNAMTGKSASQEHCEFPCPTPTHSGTIEKILEPLNMESALSETGCYTSQVNSAKEKHASSESCEQPMTGDLNICPESGILPTFNDQLSGLSVETNYMDGTSIVSCTALNSNCASWLVSGSIVTPPSTKKTFVVQGREEKMEGKLTSREGISVKQEGSELHNLQTAFSDTKFKADASCLSLNRSNWDLNTTMDAWEDSSVGSLPNNGAADYARRGLGVVPDKRLELGLKQIFTREPSGTDMTLEHNLIPNSSTSMDDPSSDTCLDLQLKPYSLPNMSNISVEHDNNRDMRFLSLGMKPMPSTSSLHVPTCITVKSEPVESYQKDAGKVQSGFLKIPEPKHVKSEPCEGQEIVKVTSPAKMNAACSGVTKQEPPGDRFHRYLRSVGGSSFHMGQNSHILDPHNIQMHQNVGIHDDSASDVASKSPVLNTVSHPCLNRPKINIPNHSSGMVGKAQGLVNEASIPGNDMSNISLPNDSSDMVDKARGFAGKASIAGYNLSISTESSALGSNPLISFGNDVNSLHEACETSSLPATLHADSLASNGDGHVSLDGVPELAVQMDALNSHHSSQETLKDGVLGKPCENSKVVKSGEVEDKDGVSSEVLEGTNSACKSDSSHVAAGAMNIVHKSCLKVDVDFEDGEVRNPASRGAVDGSCGVTAEQEVKDVGSACSADASVLTPLLLCVKDNEGATSKEAGILSSKESDGGLLENQVEASSSPASVLTADSGKNGSSRTIRRTLNDPLKNNKGLETKFKYCDLGRKTSQSSAASSKQQHADAPSLVKKTASSDTELSEKDGAKKDARDRGDNRRIIYLNSAFNPLASERRKHTSDRSISSREERGRPVDRSFRQERSRSRGSRDEYHNERSRKVETERHYGHLAERSRADFLRNRSRTDRLNALHGDMNSNSDHLLEHMNSSNGIRYSRQASIADVAIGASPDGSKRLARQTRLPCRRRSPGGREQMTLGHHPMRDTSPSRCFERDGPDFVLLAHEEELLRNMHGLGHPNSLYERSERIRLHRERRSSSPQMRRGGPLQMPPNCPKFSPRSQQHPNHHWSPPTRNSDGFNGPQKLERCRSPQPVRINRMQSPRERPRFPEELMVRRRGSPPYLTRLPDDMADVDRNMMRFDMIDHREMMEEEEEYFGPPLVHNQIREFGVSDGCVDDGMGDERRGPVRPFRQRRITGDNESESFQFHVEDGHPRALRLRPDATEGCPEGSGPRDFNARFRNRLGNPSSRMRGIAQEHEDSYRHHGEQEWGDTSFSDGRTKRRRF